MIEFTIKTLDSRDHHFSVDDETTVAQLKEKVRERMGVAIDMQRLIFCGRVLQDEKKLSEYGINGKVVHMVQRAPPCLEPREPDPPPPPLINLENMNSQQLRRLMAMAATSQGIDIEGQGGPNVSPTSARLEFLRRLITEIRMALGSLRTNESNEPRTYQDHPMESTSSEDTNTRETAEVMCHFHSRPLLYQIDHGFGPSSDERGRRSGYHTQPSDFAELVAELHVLEGEFAPYRMTYINILREASSVTVTLSEQTLQRRQRTADLCAELFHSFSHAYHTASDIGIMMAHENSRLTSEALTRHPLPAQINVVPNPRRLLNAITSGNGTVQVPPPEGQDSQVATAGRNSTQSTVNLNIQPDPVTYQVEIETAVPIPISIGNAFLNGINSNQTAQTQNQQQNQSQGGPQPNLDGPPDRRQVMIEFENLFRGLGQAGGLGGVEVVMSMEEIPQVNAGATNNSNAPTMGSQPTDSGGNPPRTLLGPQMYLAQTADLLHNIVATVFRQGLIPGMEGLVHAHVQQVEDQSPSLGQSQGQGQNQARGQPQPQTQAQTQPQNLNASQTENQSQAPNQTQTQERSQENQSNTASNANANSTNQQRQNRNRSQANQAQTISIFNLIYDRFLQCDSHHARYRLDRRREESIRAGGPRLTDTSNTRIRNNVETLFERFTRPSRAPRAAHDEEVRAIAGTVLLREAIAFSRGRILGTVDLVLLRNCVQGYINSVMGRPYLDGDHDEFAERLFQRHSTFVSRITAMSPMRPNVDVIASVRSVFTRFLNEAMTVLYMEDHSVFSRRFRIILPRMFYELCGVLAYCCLEGIDGLRLIYRAFLTELLQNLEEPIRDLLYSLAMENFGAAVLRVEAQKVHYHHFIRHYDEAGSSTRLCPPRHGILARFEAFRRKAAKKAAETETSGNREGEEDPERQDADEEDTENGEDQDDTDDLRDEEELDDLDDEEELEDIPEDGATDDTAETGETEEEKPVSMDTTPPVDVEPQNSSAAQQPEAESDTDAKLPDDSTPPSSPAVSFTATAPQNIVQSSQNRGRVRSSRSQKSGSPTSPDSSDDIRFVPPAQIAQNWGEEWVPTFTRDLQQQYVSDEPYSDAYLSGMPPKKRRCVRQARPPTTLNAFISESVNEVTEVRVAAPGEELQAAFREHVRSLARARAAASRDYEPRRFAATARFLNQPKSYARKTPETNSE